MQLTLASSLTRARRQLDAWLPSWQSRQKRRRWQRQWSRKDFAPGWLDRGISPEILAAVADGWFPAGGPALDIGCGQGEVAGWLAQRGFSAVGIDIAPAAIERARTHYPETPGRLEFHAADICTQSPPDWRYTVLIDRGCLHQLAPRDVPGYLRTLGRVAAPQARLLLLTKAFRDGQPVGEPAERRRVTSRVQEDLGSLFTIDRVAETYLDPFGGQRPDKALPGLAFWMTRCTDR